MEFRILSLPGGGARGVFQSEFLDRLQSEIGGDIRDHFDLIAATSTGALVGLALAHGTPPERISQLYYDQSHRIFRRRRLAKFRRGPRYRSSVLRKSLEDIFGDSKLEDLGTQQLLICLSVLNSFEGHILTAKHRNVTVVDAALASAAAPTYFEAVQLADRRTYVDGGLWANDPSMVAVDYAINTLKKNPSDIRMLTVGTGQVPQGLTPQYLQRMRTMSPSTIRLILDSTQSLQSWHTQQLCLSATSTSQCIRVNPVLKKWIRLDDPTEALQELPAEATRQYNEMRQELVPWLSQKRRTEPVRRSLISRYRAVLNDLTSQGNVPHRSTRRYRYIVGLDPSGDKASVEETTTVEHGHKMAWRTERIGVTQGDALVNSVDDLEFTIWTDDDCDADFLPLVERNGALRVMLVFTPAIQGPDSRGCGFEYAWPGTWDDLRTTGSDRMLIHMNGVEDFVEITVVYPDGARNCKFFALHTNIGRIRPGSDDGRQTITWRAQRPRRGDIEFRIAMNYPA